MSPVIRKKVILVNKDQRKSKVWDYFGSLHCNDVLVNDNLWHCSLCLAKGMKSAKYKNTRSTSTMRTHLRNFHPETLENLTAPNGFDAPYVSESSVDSDLQDVSWLKMFCNAHNQTIQIETANRKMKKSKRRDSRRFDIRVVLTIFFFAIDFS